MCYKSLIQNLAVSETGFDQEISQSIFQSLKYNQQIYKLDLSNNPLTGANDFLLQGLGVQNGTLVKLNLAHCVLGDSSTKALLSGLIMKQKPSLKVLNLRANMLSDKLAQTFHDYLNSYYFRLKELDLSYN